MEKIKWSKNDIKIAKKIKQKAGALAYIHEATASKYEKIDNVFKIIITLGMFIFGTSGIVTVIPPFIESFDLDSNNSAIVNNIISFILNICILILAGISTFIGLKNYPSKCTNHSRAALSYSEQFLHAEITLRKRSELRQNFSDFFSEMYRKDLRARNDAGPIPESVIQEYFDNHGDLALSKEFLFTEFYQDMDELNDSPQKEKLKKSLKRTDKEFLPYMGIKNISY